MGRRFARLTLLNIAANVTVPLVGLVDAGMLGHLPDLRFLAGVALGSVLFDYIYWSLNFLRLATTGLTAQARGRGDDEGAATILYRALFLAAAFGALVLCARPLLQSGGFFLLQVPKELVPAAADYFGARIWGAPAVLANYAFFGWFLGREESGRALAMTLAANLANVALNYVFIVRLGMAAFGAGLATAISQYSSLACAVFLFAALKPRAPWSWPRVLDRRRLLALLHLNRDIFLRTLVLTSGFAAFTALSQIFGTTTLVVNTLLLRLITFVAFFVDGAAFALESLAGVFYGHGDGPGLRRLFRMAMKASLAMSAVFVLAFAGFPRLFLGWLTSHQEVIEGGALLSRWLILVLPLGTVAYLYDGLFLGLTAGRDLRNAMLLATLGVFAPAAALAVALRSNHLLWLGLGLWMLARGLTLHRMSRRLLAFDGGGSSEALP